MLIAIIGITSYHCVFLKMVIMHDAIKTLQNGVFLFFVKKSKNLFQNPKKTGRLFFFKYPGFSQPCVSNRWKKEQNIDYGTHNFNTVTVTKSTAYFCNNTSITQQPARLHS